MQRNEILNYLAKQPYVKEAAFRIAKNKDIAEDLFQEFWIVIGQKSEEQLQQVYDNEALRWYTVRIMVLIMNGANGRSRFHKDFTWKTDSLPEHIENIPFNEYDEENHQTMTACIELTADDYNELSKQLSRSSWYIRAMWEQYCKCLNKHRMSKETKINWREIRTIIETVKGYILKKYDSLIIDR